MVALLVGMSIMAVALSVALPSWSAMAKREREEELIFRGQQYARAIALYQRRYANAFPPNFDILVEQRFLRKRYKDPMTEDGEFQPIYMGQTIPAQTTNSTQTTGPNNAEFGDALRRAQASLQEVQRQAGGIGGGVNTGLMGVVSKSTATSMRLYNGRDKYNEWAFVATQATTRAGAPNAGQNPTDRRGGPPNRGRTGAPPQRGGPARRGLLPF